ncbi:MAG TPA: alpha-amylase family glycosyl hydrolase, partial [Clostridia bacterium]|nr:alpha-amylase family glycosyl hydrolase [Clostridia bacterium]
GASGWRLDVADELPMEFLEKLRKTVKKTRPDALLLGEVWEDASNKVAYGSLRNYCHGDTLDSVMNYPIREALIDFIMGGVTSEKALALLGSQLENYPEEFLLENMNLLGSHDRTRLRTVLSGAPSPEGMTRDEQAGYKPEAAEASFATARVKCLAAFMFTMPGVPHIYYGDEAGLEGMTDPFNRKCYPWGNEDKELIDFFRKISLFRKNNQVLINGETEYLASEEIISCKRTWNGQYILALFNRNKVLRNEIKINLSPGIKLRNLFTDEIIETGNDVYLTISPGPLEPIILYYV